MDGGTTGSYSPDEFARRHRVCRASLYNLWKRGEGPRYVVIAGRRRITPEHEAEWLKRLEQQPKAGA